MKEHNPEYKIIFGKTEEEATDNTYNYMEVSLNLSAGESGARASISFDIREGYPDGQFDMNRQHVSKGMTIEEAKQLIEKMDKFVSRAEQFLEQYKLQ